MTGTPKFEVIGHDHGIPVRPRSVFTDMMVFTRDRSAAVLIDPAVALRLRDSAAASPAEVGGLLVGRQFRDDTGPYVAVLEAVQAPTSDGTTGSISVSTERVAILRQQAAHRYPSMDVIGWWHSHSVPSQFSNVDRQSQRLWDQPMHVGLLVFAQGNPWAHVYLGPEALALPLAASPSKKTNPTSVGNTTADSMSVGNTSAGTQIGSASMIIFQAQHRRWWRRPQQNTGGTESKSSAAVEHDSTRFATDGARLNWLLVASVLGLTLAVLLLVIALMRLAVV